MSVLNCGGTLQTDGKYIDYIDYGDDIRLAPVVELTDASIEQIVEAVMKKLRDAVEE